jgi:hypothetical protein
MRKREGAVATLGDVAAECRVGIGGPQPWAFWTLRPGSPPPWASWRGRWMWVAGELGQRSRSLYRSTQRFWVPAEAQRMAEPLRAEGLGAGRGPTRTQSLGTTQRAPRRDPTLLPEMQSHRLEWRSLCHGMGSLVTFTYMTCPQTRSHTLPIFPSLLRPSGP